MIRKSVEIYIQKTYGSMSEYPWPKYPGYAVYRHNDNKKWFAVVMNISGRKLGIDCDDIFNVMNVKCDPVLIGSLILEKGFYPAYHMNKLYWISVLLDGTVNDEQIKGLIDMSFDLTR